MSRHDKRYRSEAMSPLVPEFWEWNVSFPSCSQIMGIDLFHSPPVPKLCKLIPAHPCCCRHGGKIAKLY